MPTPRPLAAVAALAALARCLAGRVARRPFPLAVAALAVGVSMATMAGPRGSPGTGGTRLLAASALQAGAALAQPVETAEGLRVRSQRALSVIAGDISVAGLNHPVEVIRDKWGVAHIYARTVDDLFFAQGFVAAQDRLWQMELWRRVAEGTVSEIAGPSTVDRDTFARLLRYRGDMTAEWNSYAPDARAIVEAFVRGVNALIAQVNAQPDTLPVEFQLTGTRPRPWTPEVVIGRMAGYIMTRNAASEVQRARLAQRIGVGRVAEFMPPEPAVPIALPEGLDLADIQEGILQLARGAGDPIRFEDHPAPSPGEAARAANRRPSPGLFVTPQQTLLAPPPGPRGRALVEAPSPPTPAELLADIDRWYGLAGSNNWVVSGALSSTGKPLLANDPHRPVQLPSLRYSVHLVGPGWDVIGAGEPALPGVAAGHNDRVAFGFTIVGIDQQDLYVERLDPADHTRYLHKGQWEAMRVERETIPVRGEPARVVELMFTRHGPVVHVDRTRHRAYALRWVGSEPGTAGYLASLSLNIARNWDEFLAAAERWKVPSENLVYADVDGNIGWVAAGMAPIRPNWNGLLPVPGHEGRFEWSGFLSVADLPQSCNPGSGYIATANHNILPPGYTRMLGYEWSAPHRFERIVEVLETRRKFTVADFQALQHDETSVAARALVEALRAAVTVVPVPSPDRAFAAKMLTTWDAMLAKESAPAALYALWVPHLQQGLRDATIAPADRPHAPERLGLDRVLDIARAPTRAQLEVFAGAPLDAAMAEARQLMGRDPGSWSLGRIHHAAFEHALATTEARREVFNLADVPRGGDATTVNNTGSGRRQQHGASFREVIDVDDWDRSTMINVPGQSGQPGSRHYGDLLPLWAAGQYHPMAFSREAVERNAAARLWLRPPAERPAPPADPSSPPEAIEVPELPSFAGTVVNVDRHEGKVAACASEGGTMTIGARTLPRTYVWVVDGDALRQLGTTPGSCDPAWSPDGARLAVVTPQGLWTYSAVLDHPRLLSETHLPRQPKNETDYTAFQRPRWSADGQRIAYLVTDGATSWVEVVDTRVGRKLFKSDADTYAFEWGADPRLLKIGARTIRLP
jgi:penicillin amidase